ncbi:MAG: hypothetical protein WAV51_00810 [Microgenomates group bacterium]
MVKQLLYSIIGIFFVFVLSELFLREAEKISPKLLFFTTNPYQQNRYVTNIDWQGLWTLSDCPTPPGYELYGFVLNSKGFRTPETPYAKPLDTKRLVLLGDSQSVGPIPYNQLFINLLEKNVQSNYSNKFQAINLALPCIGPPTETIILSLEGIRYQPDIVLLAFYVGNDFLDTHTNIERYADEKNKQPHLLPFMFYQSKIVSLTRNLYYTIRFGRTSMMANQTSSSSSYGSLGIDSYSSYNPNEPTFSLENFLEIETHKASIFLPNSSIYLSLPRVQQYITHMKELTEQANAQFLVLIIPEEMQVNSELLTKVASRLHRSVDSFEVDLPQRLLMDYFHQKNIQYINLLEIWKKDELATQYYQPQDTHLNTLGNQSAAEILYPKIFELLQNR